MTRGAAVRDVLILVALAQDLHDLAVVLGEVVLLAVGGGPGIQTVQGLADAGQRAVGSLEVIPLLELETVLLVHVLGALEQGVPVILNAVFLFDEFDAVAQDLRGVRVGSRLVVDHRHGRLEVRQTDAAALEHGGRLGGVAGHVRGDHGLAEEREVVVEGNAGLRRAAGADVCRQTEGLGYVDVVRLELLVNIADDELRQRLQRDGDQVFEAGQEQRRHDLVHRDDLIAVLAADAQVVRQHKGDLLGQALHDGVHIHVRDHELGAAVALKQTVDEHERAEVGAHPAVFPEALQARDRRGGDHGSHGHDVFEPCAVVDHGVVQTAPLAVLGDAGLIIVTAAETADTVLSLPEGVESLHLGVNKFRNRAIHSFHSPPVQELIFLISRLSTKAWKRVRSWPTEPSAYSFSIVQHGTPISSVRIWEASTFS